MIILSVVLVLLHAAAAGRQADRQADGKTVMLTQINAFNFVIVVANATKIFQYCRCLAWAG
jgi:riboflavin transporter FmnP